MGYPTDEDFEAGRRDPGPNRAISLKTIGEQLARRGWFNWEVRRGRMITGDRGIFFYYEVDGNWVSQFSTFDFSVQSTETYEEFYHRLAVVLRKFVETGDGLFTSNRSILPLRGSQPALDERFCNWRFQSGAVICVVSAPMRGFFQCTPPV